MRGAGVVAIGTGDVGIGVPVVDHQVSDVGNPSEGVGEDEDRVLLVEKGVTQQQQGTGKAQPPESSWDDYTLQLLRCIPLDEKA